METNFRLHIFCIIAFIDLIVTVHVGGLSLHKLHSNWGQGINTMMQVEMTPMIYCVYCI